MEEEHRVTGGVLATALARELGLDSDGDVRIVKFDVSGWNVASRNEPAVTLKTRSLWLSSQVGLIRATIMRVR